MRRVAEPRCWLAVFRFALLGSISVTAVACSTDTHRFDSNPFNNRPQASSYEATGSVPQPQPQRHSVVQGAQLPPPNAPYASAPPTRPAMTSQAGGSPGMASYHPGGASAEMVSPPPARVAAQSTPHSGWNGEGGTAITVQHGDTIDGIVRRYGVPASAIAQANNLPNGSALRPGQRLVIPRYESTGSTTANAAPRFAAPMTTAAAGPKPAMPIGIPPSNAPAVGGQHVHIIAPGETLMKLSRQYNKPLVEIARANHIPPSTMVKVGDRIIIPGMRGAPPQHFAARQTVPQPAPVATIPAKSAPAVAQPQFAQPKIAQPKVAAPVSQRVATVPAAPATQPTANVVTPAAENPEPQKTKLDATSGLPSFRWPVNGRVIQAFGPKPSGQQNDGLNVSVPEGTPIKAAEDGVVAYAGNELKTYGNLVLIRHANGYVTAYAHASEIMVKRDDTVKRGQIIAKSGQTGSVTAPQVHFEIRKGSTPVDPAPFLNKGGAG
jgi:murein DD-endopeptidase MepM/ murein hydrolase activator NlpD